MVVITLSESAESDKIKREILQNIKRSMKDILSDTQLDELEKVFMLCVADYYFQKKGK